MNQIELRARALERRRAGDGKAALELYLEAVRHGQPADFDLSLEIANTCQELGLTDEAYRWLGRAVDSARGFVQWQAAAQAQDALQSQARPVAKRRLRAALLGSYTTSQLGRLLRLASFRSGVDLELYEAGYGQYTQELLDPSSRLYAFQPEVVIMAVHEGALQLPDLSPDPEAAVEAELERWRQLWGLAIDRAGARVIQHTFAIPPAQPFGHLSGRLGSRRAMAQALNARMMREAPAEVAFVDCDLLASNHGKLAWFDDRYWYLTKQAVSPDALPLLAQHTAAVLAAVLGLNRKCLVLDLDGTLWGGVIGEDGVNGIALGTGPAGEAYAEFQSYLLGLKQKGILLAVASKNNDADARLPFETHPDMRLRMDDFALFVADWNDKAGNLRAIARELDIGLDSLVLVDDNPAERALIRQLVPEVDVIELPPEPTGYIRALSAYLGLETATLTDEDTRRTEQYLARREAGALAATANTLEEFHRSLQMSAQVSAFDDFHMPRIAQLIGKTNQFNLTGERQGLPELKAMVADPDHIHLYLKLRDRFGDHGLVSVLIARREGDAALIETWVMSCRVIGRTVEAEMLKHFSREAAERGIRHLRGTYIPTSRNQLVRDLYRNFGFELVDENGGITVWQYDLEASGPIRNDVIAEWREAAPETEALTSVR